MTHNHEFTIDTLQKMLRDAETSIVEKDAHLQLAAEIGQSLVAANEKLQAEYEQLKSESGSSRSFLASSNADAADCRYNDLEQLHLKTISDYEELKNEYQRQKEAEKVSKAAAVRLTEQHLELQKAIAVAGIQVDKLTLEKRQLNSEKLEMSKALHSIELGRERDLKALSKIGQELATAKSHSERCRSENIELTEQIAELESNMTDISGKCQELEAMLSAYQGYRDECEDQKTTIIELSGKLDYYLDLTTKLTNRLAGLAPTSGDDTGELLGKTLLSEVDDQRKLLAAHNEDLSKKHAGLVKAHQITVCQKGRMQNHLSRLKQLSATDSCKEGAIILETALAQAESEKKALEMRIYELEQQSHISYSLPGSTCLTESASNDSRELVELLRARFNQLSLDHQSLKAEHETLRMIKRNETDRLHRANSSLIAKDAEMDTLNRSLAEIKFELDEFRLSVQTHQDSVEASYEERGEIAATKSVESLKVAATNLSFQDGDLPVSLSPLSDHHLSISKEDKENTLPVDLFDQEPVPKTKCTVSDTPQCQVTESGQKTSPKSTPRKAVLDRSKVQECNQQ